jgi:cell division protease FtsH
MLRQMQGGPKGIFSFGKSKARLLTGSRPKVTFADVAGCDEAKQELQEIIEFLRDPGKFQKLGGKIPKGALLLGPPGTGKTLLARAVAGEAQVPFFSMSGSDFVEMFVGVGASRVRDLFDQGKRNAPCIIFIDEIDAVGRHRGAGLGGGHDEREQTLNQLLVEMDGFESNEGVILIAATNRPDVLDPALLRPGRFDRQIVVDQPDVKGREGILRVHTKKIKVSEDVDLKIVARGTPGMSGADLANLVNEAALLAARKDKVAVTMQDFEEAKDKVMMGTERRSLVISTEEKKTTAFHEAGHALVAKLIPGSDPVHKVTIIPRGMALGLTSYLPVDERHTLSKEYLETKLVHIMGGRVAEKIKFNQLTTGAGNDLEQATKIARKMVCDWGMSEKIGPLALGKKNDEIFLGRDFARQRDYSEATAIGIDSEIREIVLKAEKSAMELLTANVKKLDRVAKALLEKEILDGTEIDGILRQFEEEELLEARSEMVNPGGETHG